jgi:von Willebrand factor type A domain/Aerotolerance regulator N-terminal
MNLANPTALLWLGLVVPIVIFYILKIRLRRVPTSTILFWRQIFEEKQPRSIWQHLRHLLSLLIQLAFLALLVFALAEPFFRWEVLQARRLVLVIDNSASMNATDIAPTRLAAAREKGLAILRGLRFRDEIALVAAGTQPQVLCGLTGHRRALENALAKVEPTDGPTRVQDAVALARRLIADQENGKVIVLTDGCFEDAEKLAEAPDVQLVTVGQRTANVAITRFQVRRSLTDPVGYEILVEVVNHSDEPVECKLDLQLNGDVIDVIPLKLAAEEKWSKTFEKTSPLGGRLTGKLDRPDALMADNEAYALLPKREFQPATLVTEGNHFLQMVFQANPLVKLSVAKELKGPPPAGAVTVYHRKIPAQLPPGPVLVIDPTGPCDLWQTGELLQNPIVTKQDKDSPLMAHVRLDNVVMPEARRLTLQGQPQVLVAALGGEPILAAFDRPEGKVVVLTVNMDKSDLPLRTAFPILVTNALQWFAGNRGELREALATGAVADVELPTKQAAQEFTLMAPDGRIKALPPNAVKTMVGPLDQCGIWRIGPPQAKGEEETPAFLELACNLANRQESDLRPAVGLLERAGEDPTGLALGTRPVWVYLLAAAWGLIALEWYLYQRRWIS